MTTQELITELADTPPDAYLNGNICAEAANELRRLRDKVEGYEREKFNARGSHHFGALNTADLIREAQRINAELENRGVLRP